MSNPNAAWSTATENLSSEIRSEIARNAASRKWLERNRDKLKLLRGEVRRIIEARLDRCMSQEGAAREMGISSVTLSRIENGRTSVAEELVAQALAWAVAPNERDGLQAARGGTPEASLPAPTTNGPGAGAAGDRECTRAPSTSRAADQRPLSCVECVADIDHRGDVRVDARERGPVRELRRHRSAGDGTPEGDALVSESAPSYGVRPVTQNVQLLARVLDCDVDELIDRALEEAFDRSLADPDIKAAFEALSRLAARQQAAEDASADYGMRETRPEEKAESDPEPEEQDEPEEQPARVKGETLSTAQRQRAASVVRQARLDRNLSQVEAAREIGISGPTFSGIERAQHVVAAATVRAAVAWAQAK